MNITSQEKDRQYCEETAKLKYSIEGAFLTLGERLKTVRDERLFAHEWETFEDFLNDAMGMSKSTASKFINVFEKFVLEYKIPTERLLTVGQDKLKEILPLVTDEQSAEDWLTKAETMTFRDDLRREMREAKTGIDPMKCKHEDKYTINICNICKNKWRE